MLNERELTIAKAAFEAGFKFKGMLINKPPKDLADLFRMERAVFGNFDVFIEKYIEKNEPDLFGSQDSNDRTSGDKSPFP